MTTETWERVKDLFEAALERSPGERTAFLEEACRDDKTIREEVESLIAAHERDASFMNTPVGNLFGSNKPILSVGQSFGPYEAISAIAEGGMGQVYRGIDTRLGRNVALKLLPSSYMNDPERVQRFRQEARAASALNHPNIVTIHEIGETDSVHFIATEFIDGLTLRQRMMESRMSVAEVIDVAAQIASALQAAHDAGIVHRDIKPENIMLRRDGIVKVLDFGLAKLTAQQTTPLTQAARVNTNPGVVMGTVGYMSPEQARGQDVDERTDTWSLGVVLYEMLAGHPPFEGETSSHVIVSILESEPPPMVADEEMPDELERIVGKALTKEKTLRYQAATELLHDLKSLKDELDAVARFTKELQPNAKHFGPPRSEVSATIRQVAARTGRSERPRGATSFNYLFEQITHHRAFASAAFLILLASAIGLAYVAINRTKANPSTLVKKSIAVLPVKPIDSANRAEIYEIGITDSLIRRLSAMSGFVVRPLGAMRGYNSLAQDPIAAGKEQQVDYILAPSYQLADGRIRITAELLNVATGQTEAAYRIEKDTADVFATQDAIAAEIGSRLLRQFATSSNPLTAKRGTSNEEAYRLYLQGMYLANKRNFADAQKAVEALEQAVGLDSNYARAWAGLAYAHRTLSLYPSSSISTHEAYKKSIEAINKALQLDENLSEAHSALCENMYLYEWDFAAAERECKRAIELDPDSSQAHEIFSRYLMGRGRHDEAIAEIKTAIDLEPTSRFNQRNYGRALFYARRYQEAENQFKRVIAMDQSFVGTHAWLAPTLALQGNEVEAFESFMKLLSFREVDEETVQIIQTAFQTSGWHGLMREWVKRLEKVKGTNVDGAIISAQIGDKEKAFGYLETMYQRREIWMAYLRADPRLDPLRDDPRFGELLERVEGR